MTIHLSPPVIAKRLGIDPAKVNGWIRAGELRAYNVATSVGGRPRWRIAPEALAEFLRRRQSSANMMLRPARRKRKSENVTEYF